jgi:hypothetical protein
MGNLTEKTQEYLYQVTDDLEGYITEKIKETIQNNE